MPAAVRGRRLRLLWSDLHGLERGKVLFGDAAQRATANFCLATFPLTFDREILPIPGLAFDVGLPDVEAHLDLPSMHGSWLDEGGSVGVGDLYKNHKPVAIDPRHVLRHAAAPWRDRGLHPQAAFEFEFYLLEPDPDGGWRPISTPASRVYGTGMSVDPDGVVEEICEKAETCGFAVEGWASEFDDAQFEVNLKYKDALLAADEAFLFRILVRELSARRGYRATFMGRPFADRGGSGLHVNISFKDVAGKNVLHDPTDPDQLADMVRSCLAGMLAHHMGTAAICAPTVNAYKRLLPDMMNGYWANWAHDDRTVAVRISPERGASTRLENRVPDGAANPYLITAALLHACRLGVDEELKMPQEQSHGESPSTDIHVPATLPDALEAMAADTAITDALGSELVEAFTILKQAEWDRYVKAVDDPTTTEPTPWEIEYYQPFI